MENLTVMDCLRSITFIIPGSGTSPDVEVYAYEGTGEDEGKIFFSVKVVEGSDLTADLSGFFFNLNDFSGELSSLVATGENITEFATGNVIDLGNGANMRGGGRKGYDFGLEVGKSGRRKEDVDDIQEISFTLEGGEGEFLTLDDIAQVEFGVVLKSTDEFREGSAKNTFIAPAAPDANDDSYDVFEDGATSYEDPLEAAQGIVFNVLNNDTDADGDILTITGFNSLAQYGTLEIIDGDDADSLVGDAILYTPTTDLATLDIDKLLVDTFEYCIHDGNGGTDFAEVTINYKPVADVPEINFSLSTYEVGGLVSANQILISITDSITDDDFSEYFKTYSQNLLELPAGVSLDFLSTNYDGTLPSAPITSEWLLTLDEEQSYDFDLQFTGTSFEYFGFGSDTPDSQEGFSDLIAIDYVFNSTETRVEFEATDQDIWGTGDNFEFSDDQFIGIEGNWDTPSDGALYFSSQGNVRIGFDSSLEINGGSIDATTIYDITAESQYNKTLDFLQINTFAEAVSTSFQTTSPSGAYDLDFIFDVSISATAGVNITLLETELGDVAINESISISTPAAFADNVIDLIEFDSTQVTPVEIPIAGDLALATLAWPQLSVEGEDSGSIAQEEGASNNFLQFDLDLDEAATKLFGLPVNIIDPPRTNLGPAYFDVQLLDVDVNAGLNFLQDFELETQSLDGKIVFENGAEVDFIIGESLQFANASQYDSNLDGNVEYDVIVNPNSTLENDTSVGFNLGFEIEGPSAEIGYEIDNPFSFLAGPESFSGSTTLGPYGTFDTSVGVFDLPVYNEDAFAFIFEESTIAGLSA